MPTHWSVTDNAPACNRSQTHWRTVTCPAAEYLAAQQSDPMKYCSRCAKLCKLSMQGSHATDWTLDTVSIPGPKLAESLSALGLVTPVSK